MIDVAAGEKIPRKGGPGITKSDLFVINKTDLAPYVGADLGVMEADTQRMRKRKPFVMTNLKTRDGLAEVVAFIETRGHAGAGLTRAGVFTPSLCRCYTTVAPSFARQSWIPNMRQGLAALTLGALGVVYGDIGTSPLYTMKEVVRPAHRRAAQRSEHRRRRLDDLLGADGRRHAEVRGADPARRQPRRRRHHGADGAGGHGARGSAPGVAALLLLGVFGAALFYGDSVITPAISVLGAMEGLEVVTPALEAVRGADLDRRPRRRCSWCSGTAPRRWASCSVRSSCCGSSCSPSPASLQIVQQPAILAALNPLHAWQFLHERGWHLFVAVGAIVLALTGAEALYADMGHFGKKPIRLAWNGLVLPCAGAQLHRARARC